MAQVKITTNASVDGTAKKFKLEANTFGVGKDSVSVAAGEAAATVGKNVFTAGSADDTYTFSTTETAGGEYLFTDSGNAKVTEFSAVKATGAITLDVATLEKITTGDGNDKITVTAANAIVNAGDGDDTVVVNDAATVTLGKGKDIVEIAADKTIDVKDYNFGDGDLVKSAFAVTATDGAKTFTLGTNVKVSVAAGEDYFYKLAVQNGDTKTIYANAEVCRDAEFVAEKDAVSVDASKATKTFLFVSGKGNDSVKIGEAQATYTFGKQSGIDTLAGRTFGKDDVIVFADGGDLSKIDIDAAGNLGYFTAASVQGAFGAASVVTGVNFGEKDEKIAIGSDTDGNVLAYDKDIVYYMGRAEDVRAGINVESDKDAVTLDMKANAANFRNIASVSTAAAGGAYTGWANGATSIFANTAAGNVAAIWGGSKDADFIDLTNAAAGEDIVYWGSKTADGADSVVGFDTDKDTLFLYETEDLSKLSYAVTADNEITINDALQVSVQAAAPLQVMLKDGTVKKMAVALDSNGLGDSVVSATFDSDIVIAAKDKVSNVVFADGDDDACKQVILNDKTKYVGKIYNADLQAVTSEAILIGSDEKASELWGAQGKTAVWGGSKDDDTINLVAGKDTDYVWFAAGDGKDTVKDFEAKDVVYLYNGATDAKTVAGMIKGGAAGGGDITITATKDTDVLTLTGAQQGAVYDTVKIQGLVDGEVKDYTAAVAAGDVGGADVIDFAADTKLYIGAKNVAEVKLKNNLEGCTVISLANNGDYYFKGITTIDGTAATNDLILIGNAGGDSLIGGKGANAMWGGSDGQQTMTGQVAATDYFWFGNGDGHDIANTVSSDDMIVLWNVTDIDTVEIRGEKAKRNLIIGGGATLDMSAAGGDMDKVINDGLSFMLGSGAQYTYDLENKKWVAKA